MDAFVVWADAISLIVLILVMLLAYRTLQAFRRGRRTVFEATSLVGAIVDSLSSRIGSSESVINSFRNELDEVNSRQTALQDEQTTLRSGHLRLLRYLEEGLSNDRRVISELQRLKQTLVSIQNRPASIAPPSQRAELVASEGDILAPLTDTERTTIQILLEQGPKAAPELGRRLKKSREHTARLLKKLYLEGYIDRESNHIPYRYRISEKARAKLHATNVKPLTQGPSEKA